MSWRGKYIEWYRIAQKVLGELVPELTDQEVKENVTNEDQLIVPIGYKHPRKNNIKPIPQLSIKLSDIGLELGLLYHKREQFKLFKNLFEKSQELEMEKLLKEFRSLDTNYETVLYSRGRDEKYILHRKYVSSRLDEQLIKLLLEESEKLRKGGRQIENNKSVYIPPKSSQFYLLIIKVPLSEKEYSEALTFIKPVYEVVSNIKTQKEVISDRLRKPRVKINLYREFIELLNEVRRREIISAERRRDINQKWRDNENEREELIEMLRELLSKHR
jgi:hypothetical protein